ncbi:hypothetical protein BDN70DRAFT_896635 [Pholiota conissans]|uniref:Uncharacterized protein n=1 Tax=Pholiota conissans TaxID=109636 RepID=A0A9P6CRQ8_9AGAR|nr:hypothetical protein BDN70DRAFT_896635 [Pholiota conissans]
MEDARGSGGRPLTFGKQVMIALQYIQVMKTCCDPETYARFLQILSRCDIDEVHLFYPNHYSSYDFILSSPRERQNFAASKFWRPSSRQFYNPIDESDSELDDKTSLQDAVPFSYYIKDCCDARVYERFVGIIAQYYASKAYEIIFEDKPDLTEEFRSYFPDKAQQDIDDAV